MDGSPLGPVMALVGAIITATIAGSFSYFTQITAKEQKISEFREQWIDGLRGSISQFISALSYLSILYHLNSVKGDHAKDKFDMAVSVQDAYELVNKSYNDIILRINHSESNRQGKGVNDSFLSTLETTREYYLQGNYQEAQKACNSLRDAAKPLLKYEWERVKRGEPRYNRAKLFAGIVLVLGLTAAGLLFAFIYSYHGQQPGLPTAK